MHRPSQLTTRHNAATPPNRTPAVGVERVRTRAYEIFRSRPAGQGDSVSDWLQAERELNGAAAATPTPGRAQQHRLPGAQDTNQPRGEALLRTNDE